MSATVSAGARRFVVASTLFLLASQIAVLAGAGRRVVVTLGWTIKDNLLGAETGTSETEADTVGRGQIYIPPSPENKMAMSYNEGTSATPADRVLPGHTG